ncbi:hypothetical protein K439DRAFT_1342449 [Ramaria rubella]|nr:hypothetical protein K439DRAFT_1342449 [Ramaria rubella]
MRPRKQEPKAEIFFDESLPPPNPSAPQTPSDETQYPTLKFEFQHVTETQIRRAIHRLSPFKAPGANGIPNCVIIQCADLITPFIGTLF